MDVEEREAILGLLERICPDLRAGAEEALAAGKVRAQHAFQIEHTWRFASLFELAYRQVYLDNGKAVDGISRNMDFITLCCFINATGSRKWGASRTPGWGL